MSPSWSPDKKKIAYVSFEEGTSRIFIQQLSNAELRVSSYSNFLMLKGLVLNLKEV